MKWLLRVASLIALTSVAHAGSIAVTPGSGTTVGAGSDGTNQIPASIIWGATATATLYATCVNQAIVNASGQLLTLSTQSGTWTVTANIGTIGGIATQTTLASVLTAVNSPIPAQTS